MPLPNQLRKAIQNGDVLQARTALQVELALEDTKAASPNALKHALEAAKSFDNPDLFVSDDGCLPFIPETEWDSGYFRKIRAALISNFSKEKLELAERVILYLRKEGNPDFQVKPKKTEKAHGSPFDQTEPDDTAAPEFGNNARQDKDGSKSLLPGNEKSTGSARLVPDNNPFPAILLGAAFGGGAGLVVGLIAGITLKATICGGILVGGIAGTIASRTKNNR